MSSGSCAKASPRVNAASDYINDTYSSDTKTLLGMLQLSTDGDLIPGYLKIGSGADGDPVENLDALVSSLSDGRFKTIEDLEGSTDVVAKNAYSDALKIAVTSLYKLSNNPGELMSRVGASSRLSSFLKMQVAMEKGSMLVRRIANFPLKLFGNPESIEFFSNRPTVLRMFEPAARAYYRMSKINNFVNSYNSKPANGVKSILDYVSKNKVFSTHDIDREVFSKIFPMFDKQLLENAGDGVKENFKETLAMYKVGVTDEQAAIIFDEFVNVRDTLWYEVNYGYSKVELDKLVNAKSTETGEENKNKLLLELAAPGSILGNFRILSQEFMSFYNDHKGNIDKWSNTRHSAAIKEVVGAIEEFSPREGYIPGNGAEVGSLSLFGENSRLVFSTNFMNHRADEATFDQGDFFNGAITHIQGSGIQLDEASRIIGYNATDLAMKENPEWFRSNGERRAVYSGLRNWLHDQRLIIDSPAEHETHAAKSIKRLSAMAGLIPASILLFPGSALNNAFAGAFNLFMSVGNESKMGKFVADFKEGGLVALAVDDYAKKFMTSPGIVSEFEAYSPIGQTRGVGDTVLSWVQKAADKMGEGILGVAPGFNDSHAWKRVFGMKGSEEMLREHVKAVLYNRINRALEGMPLEKQKTLLEGKDTQRITDMIRSFEQDAWFDVTQALGDFSPTSKPYMAHVMADTAGNAPQAMLGAFMKFLYVFRHPMAVTLENFAVNLSKATVAVSNYKQTMDSMSPAAREALKVSMAAGGVGIAMASYEFIKDVLRGDEDTLNLPYLETLNPFQEYKNPLNLFYASMIAPLIGSPISEGAYKEIVASNVAFAANLLGGKGLGRAMKEDGGASAFMTRLGKIADIPELLYDIALNGESVRSDRSALFNKRRELRDATADITASDPLWILERGFELAFIKDPNNPGQVNNAFRSDTVLKSIASVFGFSVWRNNPKFVSKRYGMDDYMREYDSRNEDYVRKTGGSYGKPYNNAALSSINSLRRYGKTFAPKPENIVGYPK